LEADRIVLKPENFDIHFPKYKDDKDNNGFMQCYVNGYMYLNIKNIEYIKQKLNNK